jgi:RNA recognition motif-containing protein
MGRRLKVHAARWRRDDDNSRRGSSLTLPTQKRNERSDEFRNRDLYVRGLPKFPRKADRDQGILDLFEGFELETIGKLISPGSSVCEKPGNHHYCFVNLLRKEDIDRAIVALDGISRWGWNVIVSRPTGSGKLHRRQDVYVAGLPLFKDEKTLEIEMMDLFQQFGDIKVVSKILKKPFLVSNQKNRGYCYVEFADRAQADATVAALDQTERWDWRITVRLSNILKSKEGWRGDSKS